MKDRSVRGGLFQRLPEQVICKSGHWNPAALTLAVKQADHVVG